MIQVKLFNYNTILTSALINRLFLPIPDYAECSNNRADYAYGRLIGTALSVSNIIFLLSAYEGGWSVFYHAVSSSH